MGQEPVSVSMLIAGHACSLLAMHGGGSSRMHVDMLTVSGVVLKNAKNSVFRDRSLIDCGSQ